MTAMTKNNTTEEKHGWDENGGVYHCSDGEHPSWWLSIVKTPQWEAWYKHASKNMLYDVDECQECGWMSEAHAKDFLAFIYSQARLQERKDTLESVWEWIDRNKRWDGAKMFIDKDDLEAHLTTIEANTTQDE